MGGNPAAHATFHITGAVTDALHRMPKGIYLYFKSHLNYWVGSCCSHTFLRLKCPGPTVVVHTAYVQRKSTFQENKWIKCCWAQIPRVGVLPGTWCLHQLQCLSHWSRCGSWKQHFMLWELLITSHTAHCVCRTLTIIWVNQEHYVKWKDPFHALKCIG